jgi:hypothetical protein
VLSCLTTSDDERAKELKSKCPLRELENVNIEWRNRRNRSYGETCTRKHGEEGRKDGSEGVRKEGRKEGRKGGWEGLRKEGREEGRMGGRKKGT